MDQSAHLLELVQIWRNTASEPMRIFAHMPVPRASPNSTTSHFLCLARSGERPDQSIDQSAHLLDQVQIRRKIPLREVAESDRTQYLGLTFRK